MKKKTLVDKVYKLTRDAAPLSFMLPTRNSRRFPLLWFDEDKGENRALRYSRNQKTPFEDEQDGNVIIEPVIFEDGFLRVPRTNPVLQEFLAYHPLNGKKFIEVDDEKTASGEVQNLNYEVDALVEARNLNIEQVESVARVLLGIDPTKISTAELRRDVLIYAKKDPRGFMNIIEDPMLKLQSKVKGFFDKGVISFRKQQKEVWYNTASNKKKMLTIPFGEDPLYIVASYLQSDDGIEMLKMLEKVVKD